MHTHACKHACNKACHMLGSRGEVEATSASSNNAVSQHHKTSEKPKTISPAHLGEAKLEAVLARIVLYVRHDVVDEQVALPLGVCER